MDAISAEAISDCICEQPRVCGAIVASIADEDWSGFVRRAMHSSGREASKFLAQAAERAMAVILRP
jgi:hypothetical protein